MVALCSSGFVPTTGGWSFEVLSDEQNKLIIQNENTDLFKGLHVDNNSSPPSHKQSKGVSDFGEESLMAKKLKHNASERSRRKKMNFLYSSLRSLLPSATQKKKKLSFPATVSFVQEYIPELKKEIERLSQTKNLLLSTVSKKGDLIQHKNQRHTMKGTSSTSITASPLCHEQVLIQISTTQANGFPISEALKKLEEDGLLLLNASSFKSFGDKIFHSLHLQMQGPAIMELQILKTKLLLMYEKNLNLI